MSSSRTIVIGGGLAGLSAAHELLDQGRSVTLLDKKSSLGGNSVKASSGINGAGTDAQLRCNISDSAEAFARDTTDSAGPGLARPHLINALTSSSASAIAWLSSQFAVDLSLVSRLGGHSIPRTHRGKGGAPGWAITSALIKQLDGLTRSEPEKIKVVKNAQVTDILVDNGRPSGVRYSVHGETFTETGNIVIATGGYAADFTQDGYLSQFRPDLLSLPTTNGDHATGDGHRLVSCLPNSAALCDMDQVQVHPTGFVDPKDRNAKTKFLAAEALRGAGGLLVNSQGERFVNELDRRDVVTAEMQKVINKGKGPIWMIMNEDAYQALKAHCDFYLSKGLMRKYDDAKAFSEASRIILDSLRTTFDAHRKYADGEARDPFEKSVFDNAVYNIEEPVFVAEMTPVVHYTMGGIAVDGEARVLDKHGVPIPGLYAAGEVIGGVHGQNRLGGSSLLEAVVFGRIAGQAAAREGISDNTGHNPS